MQPNSIDQIFWDASQLASPGERGAYLDRECAGDAELRRKVELLLEARSKAERFLETPAIGRLAGELAAAPGEGDTQTSPTAGEDGEGLDFLEPSGKSGVLGRLGHYEVQGVVGRGGMGVVLKAFDENLHRVVAVKVLAPQLAASAPARQRFTREARAAAAVTHDHIVTIHAVEEAEPLPYIVMQYVPGFSLQDRIDQSGPLRLVGILRIGMQTARGLAAAHAQGLVHRDVKPSNILLENGVERVKLTDFGLARAADDASLTQSGVIAGTPQYMSPEQAEGKAIDARSDLFSLGSVLYAMCTGRPPFRGSTARAVLKRVCEETPTPIREINPEIPDWLVAVVEKLHAKDPAARFQSAAEVAEVLGQQLAHVQHPSVMPLPAVARLAEGPAAPARPAGRKRWAVAAAVLVAMFAALGVSEATGVTNVRATVTRIFTPDGTLVVETDDPDVKVTVEGDGGLVVTGAGLQEIRLKPGSYRVLADRDGKRVPLDRELVTVSRGDREIVRVKLESAPLAPIVTAEKGAFVLLAAGTERKFDTLAEAVMTSADGDTIEVRGNGPFDINCIEFKHALTVRAGSGFRPVLSAAAPEKVPPWGSLLMSHGPLRLEGLEFRCTTAKVHQILYAIGPVWVANCRFQFPVGMPVCIRGETAGVVRNSEMLSLNGATLAVRCNSDAVFNVSNCILVGHTNLGESVDHGVFDFTRSATVRLSASTFVSPHNAIFLHLLYPGETPVVQLPEVTAKKVHLSVTDSILDGRRGAFSLVQTKALKNRLAAADVEALITRRVTWSEERNLYSVVKPYIQCEVHVEEIPLKRGNDFPDWNRFWGQKDTRSSEGIIRFQGGDLHAKALADATKLTPQDFRLRPDSAGYRAGKDGKDLGADVDLVGPGAAYERWKKTPDYQQWLKESGQTNK